MSTPPDRSRRRPWRIAGMIVAALLLGLAALYTYQYVTKGRFWRETFLAQASKTAGRKVAIAGDFQLYLHPNIRFVAEGLSIANPDWAKDRQLLTARQIETDISLWQLILGRQHLRTLLLDGAAGDLEIDAAGRNTWTFAGDKPFKIPAIDAAAITGSRIRYRDAIRRADVSLTFGDVGATATGKGDGRVDRPLTFAGGGTAMGAPFTLTGSFGSPNSTIAGGRTTIDLHARVADSRIDIAGTLPGPTIVEGADLRVTVAGNNLQSPFKLIGVAVPATRAYKLASNLTKTGDEYRFTRLTGRFGDSDLAGKLTISRPTDAAGKPGRIRIDGDLATRVLSILDVGPLIGYSPAKLDAQGGKGAVTMVGGHPRVLPDAPLAVEGLKAFDARIDYTAAKVGTGTADIRNLALKLRLDDRQLLLDPLAFDLAGGRLTAKIDLNARVVPIVTDYDIRLSQVPLGKLLTQFKVEDSGTTASLKARIQLRGRGDTVHKSLANSDGRIAIVFPKGTLWIRNIELAKLDLQNFVTAFLGKKLKEPRQINCGLVAFTVKDGVGRADPIIFDTNRANFTAKGQISFVDESLGLSFRGDSKEFSLFSGQSPIAIGGYFAAPKINPISPQLITRAAAAVALGVVGTPVASLLAFVDLGNAKDTNCAPIEAAKTEAAVVRAQPAKVQKKLAKDLKR